MATFESVVKPVKRRRLTTSDVSLAFAACAFPVFAWSIVFVLYQLPAWLLRLNLWDLIGTIAYTQAFALLESALILLSMIALAYILPPALLSNRFASLTGLVVFVGAAWAIALRFNYEIINDWGARRFLPWLILASISLALPYFLLVRSSRLEKTVLALLSRLSVLSYLYMAIGLLSLLVVFLRNI